MGTESGGSSTILALGNGRDKPKKALGLEWGVDKSCIGNGGDVNKKRENCVLGPAGPKN